MNIPIKKNSLFEASVSFRSRKSTAIHVTADDYPHFHYWFDEAPSSFKKKTIV